MFVVRIADLIYSIDIESYEENRVLGEGLRSGRAHYISTDLRREAQILGGLRLFRKPLMVALKGVEVVFDMAFHHSVNLQGKSIAKVTRRVISFSAYTCGNRDQISTSPSFST
ncbi:3beta-hydroxysteroid-dehydrogenase/decarboxylase isoform 4 [Gossypium australe]|uniref:3beta-hydroxysteroid-dehydrogenase/decarboxylase isoform 4 n=1 Tax=Gossypium australe TaxID=47621 RepID=A0A5B6UKL3_9ROSI|nr:3beta-hydroxysteroid-dehydrogenase/decarboxylase isoform 4 [Gossypium australe]